MAAEEKMEQLLNEGERLDILQRENIRIIQSSEVFSFSLDALLLAQFAQVPRQKKARIVDLCSGNGAVAFLLSSRTRNPIIGVELQEQLVDMANRTVKLNGLEDKVSFLHQDVNHLTEWLRSDSVDVITCNPPYFKNNETSTKNAKDTYTIARHEIHLNLEQLMSQTGKLLKTRGKAYFVHRPDRFLEIIDEMRRHRLAPKRVRFIYPRPGREANMLLIEAIKDGKEDGFKILPPLFVYNEQNEYTPEIMEVYYGESGGQGAR